MGSSLSNGEERERERRRETERERRREREREKERKRERERRREREPALASGGTDGGRGRRVLAAGFSGDALTPQRDEGFPPVLS